MRLILLFESKNYISDSTIHRLGWERTRSHGPLPYPRGGSEINLLLPHLREESRDRYGPRWFEAQECPGDTPRKVAERTEISSLLKPRKQKVLMSSCQKPQAFSEFSEFFLERSQEVLGFIVPICCTHEKGS